MNPVNDRLNPFNYHDCLKNFITSSRYTSPMGIVVPMMLRRFPSRWLILFTGTMNDLCTLMNISSGSCSSIFLNVSCTIRVREVVCTFT